ncbi:MAG: SGNH/GDSL hydrolase family protein [Acidobacteriota bacterium]
MSPSSPSRSSRPRRLLLGLVVAFLALTLLEGLASWLWLLPDYRAFRGEQPKATTFKEESHSRYDPDIGWVHVPDRHLQDFYGPGADITINADGFRGLNPDLGPAGTANRAGRYRVVSLGDSFTLGYGVGDGETYPAWLERLNPGVETVNLGQGGYSVGQCALWYQRVAEQLDTDLLLYALIVDDIWRMGSTRTANGYGLPRFELVGDAVQVSGQPVADKIASGAPLLERGQAVDFFLRESALARSLRSVLPSPESGPEALEAEELVTLTLALLRDLEQDAKNRQATFAVVLLPELRELPDDASSPAAATYRSVSETLTITLRRRGVPYLDLRPAFRAQGPTARAFYLDEVWHHYSPSGNRFVAEGIDAWLSQSLPGYPRRLPAP